MSIFRLHLLCSKYIKTSSAILYNFETQSYNSLHIIHDRTFRVNSDKNISRTFSTSCCFYKEKETVEDKVTTISSKYAAFKENQEKKRIKRYSVQMKRDTDDILEIMFGMNHLSKRIRNTNFRIEEMRDLTFILLKLGFRALFIAAPSKEKVEKVVDKDAKKRPPPLPNQLEPRPPVVTIMGHIDHGKTSLLDYLRKSRIVEGEHGGITQHIGAFTVKLETGQAVTFIDTPGHAAFTGMRSRGANITDIVILIIDSCEGILEQTKESLRMIRQAKAPFIVALNKIDKPDSDVDMVKEQLKEEGVLLEEHGGEVQCVPISAKQGTNVNKLVEEVLTLAEILELKCDKTGLAEGVVIESQVEKGFGRTATVLLQRGVLKPSNFIVGDKAPSAGSEILGVTNETRGKEVVQWRKNKEMQENAELQLETIEQKRKEHHEKYTNLRKVLAKRGLRKARFDNEFNPRLKESEDDSEDPKVSIIIKGDVDGSVEAILDCLETYTCPDVELDIVSFGVGEVSESDLVMAEKFDAIIYAFNTSVQPKVAKEAETKDVSIRQFNVIYHLTNDLKNVINDEMPEFEVEDITGKGTVLQEFIVTIDKKKVPVAGTKVIQGKISRNSMVRVERNGETIYDGPLLMLKHHKDEVDEVKNGQECGLKVDDVNINFNTGDSIICYTKRLQREKTSWDPGF